MISEQELVRELRKAFVGDEDGKDGPLVDQMALDAAAESLDALIAEMAISTSDYNQHIDVKTFAHKAMAMVLFLFFFIELLSLHLMLVWYLIVDIIALEDHMLVWY